MSVLPTAPALASAKLIDPQALMTIRSLELRARAVVEGFWKGMHRSPYHGFSVEFTEYRQYTPGDDPRYLDWRVYARSDRYFIKKYEDETNLRVYLLADQSKSMDYGSRGYTKATYASTMAATLAYFLHLQGDAVGLLTFDEKVREYLPARQRVGHLRQIMLSLERPGGGKGTDLLAPLERITALIRKRGLVALMSDFLAPIDRLERSLIALTACGHEVTVFQIVDPAEIALGLEAASVFEDVESAQTLYIDPAAARSEYVKKFEAHCAALHAICRKLGISYQRLSTDQPLEIALFGFLQERMRRGRQFRRASSGGGRG
ncbi:DUF58 domain-containing protein [Horticoccus sp. 23ND18S-11]|uniref:DUF58 domain-containing protein n=1 Tax=Horticoccus sp. 23ND18S-11 TaxID=3391832 RepID=UPI0039C92075